jgi:hypothetical protein
MIRAFAGGCRQHRRFFMHHVLPMIGGSICGHYGLLLDSGFGNKCDFCEWWIIRSQRRPLFT